MGPPQGNSKRGQERCTQARALCFERPCNCGRRNVAAVAAASAAPGGQYTTAEAATARERKARRVGAQSALGGPS